MSTSLAISIIANVVLLAAYIVQRVIADECRKESRQWQMLARSNGDAWAAAVDELKQLEKQSGGPYR